MNKAAAQEGPRHTLAEILAPYRVTRVPKMPARRRCIHSILWAALSRRARRS